MIRFTYLQGNGDKDSVFKITQNDDGYMILESFSKPGNYFGVRTNGNIMPTDEVDPSSMNGQFIMQKEAVDFI